MGLKLTVLVDNNSLIDRYLLAEPALCFFIEADGLRLLFDTGYSGIFLENARKLGIDLANLDYLALSHGHEDHTWGLEALIRLFSEREIERLTFRRPEVVAHPKTFSSIVGGGSPESGPLVSKEKLAKHFPLSIGVEPRRLGPRLWYLGEIPRLNEFEGKLAFGRKEGESSADTVPEDSALVYRSNEGLVVISGCAHSGICNTIEYAKRICSENRVVDVIGGFHLQRPSAEHLEGTLSYFQRLDAGAVHACHCTDLRSKIALSRVAEVREVGVGLSLEYE